MFDLWTKSYQVKSINICKYTLNHLNKRIISGVQIIKMYGWEKAFSQLIAAARQSELKMILRSGYMRALHMTLILFTHRLVLFCSVLSIILLYGRESITVSKVFLMSSLFSMICTGMGHTFVRGIIEVGESLTAIKRLQAFLQFEEINDLHGDNSHETTSKDIAISMKNVSAGWGESLKQTNLLKTKVSPYENQSNPNEFKPFMLKDINVELSKGKLIFVIGSVGAGKSTLLQILMRELPLICGSIQVNGSISYASQQSWIFTSTIRQNITFGQPMDQSRYDEVVRCAALEKDFEQLPEGDLTVVGENGCGLSGGQKSRIK